MKEGHPVGLSEYVSELARANRVGPRELDEAVDKRVVLFPGNAQNRKAGLIGLGSESPDYSLEIGAEYALPQGEIEDILREALERSKSLRLPRWQYVVKLRQAWKPEDFMTETGLPSFAHSQTRITSEATIIEPNEVRMMGTNKSLHRARVDMEVDLMTIEADGKYRNHLRDFIEILSPQAANVQLSQSDAESLVELNSKGVFGRLRAGKLKKHFKPENRVTLHKRDDGLGELHIERDVIMPRIKTGVVSLIGKQLGKDLFCPAKDQESRVVSLYKYYEAEEILLGRRFEDMKIAVEMLNSISFGPHDGVAIFEGDAKALLDKELEKVQDFYKDDSKHAFALYNDERIDRGNVVKRLAGELLGSEVVEQLDNLDVIKYVQFLKSKGYIRGQFEVWNLLPPNSLKERHLLEFYIQFYNQHPSEAVSLYRKDYMNTPPSTKIDADVISSRIHRLKVAPRATVYAFGVKKSERAVGYDGFAFGKEVPDSDNVHVLSVTNLERPELLPLQDWACERLGISFG